MLEAVEKRFAEQPPAQPVQWLSDNGSAYIAEQTLLFAREIGLQPVTTPVRSPQSNGMAESFVKTIKRDHVAHMPKADRETALRNLAITFEQYNEKHPHSALKYRSPREFRRLAAASIQRGVGVRSDRGKSSLRSIGRRFESNTNRDRCRNKTNLSTMLLTG